MIYTHPLEEVNMDLLPCTAAHAGDEIVEYKKAEGAALRLSIYEPAGYGREKAYPAFFVIHGGGWAGHKIFEGEPGWQGDYLGYLARYYANRGIMGICIDYRLLQEGGQKEKYQLADLYEDCADGMDYILDRASALGIDTKSVYILGESAGGHLAGLLATKYRRAGFQFRRAFLVNAITDLCGDESWRKRVPRKSCHPELADLPQEEYAGYLSPLSHIRKGDCPVVLIHGAVDHVVKPAHSERFYEKKRSVGGECDLHWIQDTDHAFLLAEYTSNLIACKIGIRSIDGYLEREVWK